MQARSVRVAYLSMNVTRFGWLNLQNFVRLAVFLIKEFKLYLGNILCIKVE